MKVSVIIPVYNAEKYIADSLESVLKQTYQNFELIIINDGSTDQSEDIIQRYLNDPRIKYIVQENKGEATARNRGIDLARGDYIAFLDADDLYHKYKIEGQLAYLQKHPTIDIVYTDAILINEFSQKIGELKSENIISERQNFIANILYRQIIPAPAAIMMRRKCIETGIRYPEEYLYAEDYVLTIHLAKNFTFGYLPKALYFYRRHNNNLTNNHQQQLENEKKIIHSLGIKKIHEIVKNTTYEIDKQDILLAKIFLKIGELQRAIELLNNSGNNGWECYFLKGVIFYKLEQFKKANAAFENGRSIKEKAEILNNLGCCCYKLGYSKDAIIFFEKAIKLRKNYNDPLMNLKALEELKDVKITEKKLRDQLTNYNSLELRR